MATIDKREPEAVLHLSGLDTELVQVLAKHWLVIAEPQDNQIILTLYKHDE